MDYSVYFIEHTGTRRGYVGLTKASVKERFSQHLTSARAGSASRLHEAMREHGFDNFRVSTIEEVGTKSEAIELEREWIKRLDTYEGPGYNGSMGGEGGNVSQFTEDEVREMMEAYLGDDKLTAEEIAGTLGCSVGHAWHLLSGSVHDIKPPGDMKAAARRTNAALNCRGEDNGNSKLTEDLVWEIRQRYMDEPNTTALALAEEYRVSPTVISSAIRGDHWSHVPMPGGLDRDFIEQKRCDMIGKYKNNAKLTEDQVWEIRCRYLDEDDATGESLAEDYPISGTQVVDLVAGRSWLNVPMPDGLDDQFMEQKARSTSYKGEANKQSKLTEDQVREIRHRYKEEDISQTTLAEDYPVGRGTISDIVRREIWQHVD